jgi:hypothetical protein
MGTGAATTINLGTTNGTAGNVFVGSTLGTNLYNLRLRANGQYNLITSLTSAGGYGIATYSNIAVTGGSGNGMIISMSGVASGYLGSANITNPGTGYVNGDTITIPAGNPVGSLGGSFVLQNYNATKSSTQIGTGIWTFHIEGNLSAPGNITIVSNSSYFIGNALGTTATYTGNVTATRFIGDGSLLTGISSGGSNYSNANVASYLPTYSGNVANLTVTNTLTLTATTIALGSGAGLFGGQGTDSIAIGRSTGQNIQGNSAVAVGGYAGQNNQGDNATAIGQNAGFNTQSTHAVAVGSGAGQTFQSLGGVAVGYAAGSTSQGIRAVAIGSVAGNDHQGQQAIAIGHQAGYSYQPANSIEINASGTPIDYTNLTAGLYITSVKNDTANVTNVMYYNTTTNEITYGPVSGGSYSNVQVATYLPTYSGNIGNITVTGNVRAAGIIANTITGAVANANTTITAGTYTTTFDTNGNVTVQGNVVANYLFGNGFYLTGVVTSGVGGSSSYGNANVAQYLPTYQGNIVAANVWTTGNANGVGALTVGPAGYTVLPTTLAQFTGNANTYTQLNLQNISTGTDATAEYVATANNGTDTTFFVDMGIANSNYDVNSPANSLGTTIYPNDSYLYAQGNLATTTGGNLAIGTSTPNKSVKIFAGGINSANIVATVSNTGLAVTGNVSATGNITAGGYIVTAGGFGNISQVDYITANNVVATANVTVQGMGVTMPNRPAFRVNGTSLYSGAQSTANVNLKGVAVSTAYNQGNYFDATTGKFTAPIAGIYEVLLNARVNSSFNGLAQLVVLKNGLNTSGNVVAFWETSSNIGGATHFGVSGTVVLASGDYLSANILAGNVTFDNNDNWSVTYLG